MGLLLLLVTRVDSQPISSVLLCPLAVSVGCNARQSFLQSRHRASPALVLKKGSHLDPRVRTYKWAGPLAVTEQPLAGINGW